MSSNILFGGYGEYGERDGKCAIIKNDDTFCHIVKEKLLNG